MNDNAFGKLIRAARSQRGWKQSELADRWGFTREYISQIERGKRKLDNPERVTRLAEILGISEEQLAHAGKSSRQHSDIRSGDDLLLEALLKPAQTTVKLSWLIWQNNGVLVGFTHALHDLEKRLKDVLGRYRGQFYQPAMYILASVHEMFGRQAVDQAATEVAITHFQAMYDIAEELGDTEMLTLATIHLAAMLRRKGRLEASLRRLEASERSARGTSSWLQGLLAKTYARTYSVYGDEQGFLRAIDQAATIAADTEATIDTIINGFDHIGVLVERAQGYTLLWQPEKALLIYQKTDQLCPFLSPRAECASHIGKAETHCSNGDLQTGIEHARAGLRLAEQLQSSRYVMRLQQMSDRLGGTPMGKSRAMRDLRSEILSTWDKLKGVHVD